MFFRFSICTSTIVGGDSSTILKVSTLKWNCTKMPDLAKFRRFGNSWRVYIVLGKILNLLWLICYAVGQIFTVKNSQILKNNLTIWSRCIPCTCFWCMSIKRRLEHSVLLSPIGTKRNKVPTIQWLSATKINLQRVYQSINEVHIMSAVPKDAYCIKPYGISFYAFHILPAVPKHNYCYLLH